MPLSLPVSLLSPRSGLCPKLCVFCLHSCFRQRACAQYLNPVVTNCSFCYFFLSNLLYRVDIIASKDGNWCLYIISDIRTKKDLFGVCASQPVNRLTGDISVLSSRYWIWQRVFKWNFESSSKSCDSRFMVSNPYSKRGWT